MQAPVDTPKTDPEDALRTRRFLQIAGFTEAALLLRTVVSIDRGEWSSVMTLTAGLCAIVLSLWWMRNGMKSQANLLLLCTLTAVMSLLAWLAEGIFDVAVLGYPCILIMAGLLLPPRYFFALFALIVATVGLLTYAALVWLHPFDARGETLIRFSDTVLILAVSGFSVWVMTNDLSQLLRRLREEILRVQQSEQSLTYLARHDTLTTLPNRLLGRELIERAIANARRKHGRVALLFVDIDHFKSVNDTLGHGAGDELLIEVAQRLTRIVRASDIVSRQGGDEFLIALTDIGDVDAINTAAAHIIERLVEPYALNDAPISSSCSIGIAVFPDDGEDFDALLRLADIGMYEAKESGRNTFRFYDGAMNSQVAQNVHLTTRLRQALASREFVLHYQPLIDLASGGLRGAEALIRWQQSEQDLILPGEFIPAAERSGLIIEIDEWALNEACQQMQAWQALGAPPFIVSVNLSAVRFKRGNIEQVVADALARTGLAASCLELEITESMLVQNTEEFIKTLHKLKSLGVTLAIDDFGVACMKTHRIAPSCKPSCRWRRV
jgi:diguanylate cyclase (GGDEF)-like protein